jgi:hypothetical protein
MMLELTNSMMATGDNQSTCTERLKSKLWQLT